MTSMKEIREDEMLLVRQAREAGIEFVYSDRFEKGKKANGTEKSIRTRNINALQHALSTNSNTVSFIRQ